MITWQLKSIFSSAVMTTSARPYPEILWIFCWLIFYLFFVFSLFFFLKSLEYVCSEVPTKHRQPDRWRVTLLFPRILLRGIQSIKIIKLAIFRPRLTPSQTAVKLRVPSASSSSVAVVWPWIRWRACTRVCVGVDASVGGLLDGCKREFFFWFHPDVLDTEMWSLVLFTSAALHN